jgi:hypothetical protein
MPMGKILGMPGHTDSNHDYVPFSISTQKRTFRLTQRIYRYLRRFKDAAIRAGVGKLDLSKYATVEQNWLHFVYGNIAESVPGDVPDPLWKSVLLTHYTDATLYHDMVTGRAVTAGVLHFINITPIEWFSKRQGTV